MDRPVRVYAVGASFVADLAFRDLCRLRAIVKKIHFRHYPKELITDREADKLIEAVGPQVSERLLKQKVDEGHFR